MARASIEDPIKVFRFRIRIDGFIRAGFSEVSGFARNTEVVKYRESGDNETERKSAGLSTFEDVTLKRGQIVGGAQGGSDDFITWHALVHNLQSEGNAVNYRKDFDTEQYNAMNIKARTWRTYHAWPNKDKPFSDLKALGSEDSMEEMTLCNEGHERVF